MRLGVIGPENSNSVKVIEKIIEEHYPDIKLYKGEYKNLESVEGLVKELKYLVDAMLFTGKKSFLEGEKSLPSKMPVEYMIFGKESIKSSLLRANLVENYSIDRICCLTGSRISARDMSEELGLSDETFNGIFPDLRLWDKDDDRIFDEFCKRFKEKKLDCIITTVTSLYNRFTEEKIPCYKIIRSEDKIQEAIERLYLKSIAEIQKSSQIVVLRLSIDRPPESSIENKSEYYFVLRKIDLYKEVYRFAESIQGAIIELGFGDFIIISTRNIVETVTKNFTNISIIDDVRKTKSGTVSLGLGFGRTAIEARTSADLGRERARKNGGNCAFVVYDGDKFAKIKSGSEIADEVIDEWICEISKNSNVGINTVFKLHRLKKEYRLDEVTPKELANLYGITLRSMNKILNKLEAAGYIETVNYQQIGAVGRPSRIIKLKI